jgi:hypothetical protein
MSDLSPEARALFEASRAEAPAPGESARLRRALDGRLGLVAVALPAAAAGQAGGLSVLVKVVVGVTLAISAGTAAWKVSRPAARLPVVEQAAQLPELAPAPAPAVAEPVVDAEPATPAPAPVRPTVPGRRAVRPPATHTPPHGVVSAAAPALANDELRAELELISQAQHALSAEAPEKALALLEQHAARFPRGQLRPERLAARVLALCSLGRIDEAKAEAERFFAEAPSSPMSSRVRDSCAGLTSH